MISTQSRFGPRSKSIHRGVQGIFIRQFWTGEHDGFARRNRPATFPDDIRLRRLRRGIHRLLPGRQGLNVFEGQGIGGASLKDLLKLREGFGALALMHQGDA